MTTEVKEAQAQFVNNSISNPDLLKPIELEWKVLMDILYRLRYFSEIETDMYAPLFSKTVKTLHKKKVINKGFIIPFDEENELLSLSFNPYASCFFCGKRRYCY